MKNKHTEQQIRPAFSEVAKKVLPKRYLRKGPNGKVIETPDRLFSRVAESVAKAEARYGACSSEIKSWQRKFYNLMASLKFLPNSPALMNANPTGGIRRL